MTEPTYTLQELRRHIARKLRMPFFQRFPSGSTLTGAASDNEVSDSNLTQEQDYWEGDWFYHVGNQETRLVTGFQANDETLLLEFDLDTTPQTGETYELHSMVSPEEIHQEINEAIQDAHPEFADVVEDESIILEEDTVEYDLTSLTTAPHKVLKIFIENAHTVLSGTADADSSTSVLEDDDLQGELGDVDSNWKISIYAGTGSGQIRDVQSVNDTTGTVTPASNWSTGPDDTSKYKLWDPTDEVSWDRLESAQFDSVENPSTLYLLREYTGRFGFRMRLQYIAEAQTLSAESDTTVVPKRYITLKVLSEIAGRFVPDNRYNRRRFASVEEFKRQQAAVYRADNAFEYPAGTVWKEHDTGSVGGGSSDVDPLWRGGSRSGGGFNY